MINKRRENLKKELKNIERGRLEAYNFIIWYIEKNENITVEKIKETLKLIVEDYKKS